MRNSGSVKGIGFNDIGTRFEVLFVDFLNNVWLGKTKNIVVAFLQDRNRFKTISPVVFFFQFVALYHGSHGSVQHQYTGFQQFFNIRLFYRHSHFV